jgi:hypothetical protein
LCIDAVPAQDLHHTALLPVSGLRYSPRPERLSCAATPSVFYTGHAPQ